MAAQPRVGDESFLVMANSVMKDRRTAAPVQHEPKRQCLLQAFCAEWHATAGCLNCPNEPGDVAVIGLLPWHLRARHDRPIERPIAHSKPGEPKCRCGLGQDYESTKFKAGRRHCSQHAPEYRQATRGSPATYRLVRCLAQSDQSQRFHAAAPLAADDDMIVDGDAHVAAGVDQVLGQANVLLAGGGVARRMVVDDDDGGRA